MIKVMNSVEIEKKIRELVEHYLIKDYHVTVKRGDVILWRVVRIMGCREGLCPFSGLWHDVPLGKQTRR